MSRCLWLSMVVCASRAFADEADAGVEAPPMDAGVKVAAVEAPPPAPPALTARRRRAGDVGIGFLGTVPVFSAAPVTTVDFMGQINVEETRVTVPMIGVRWWSRGAVVGFEAGIGAMYYESKSDTATSRTVTTTQNPSSFNWVAHLALPLALFSAEHVIIFASPEFRVGNSNRTAQPSAVPNYAWTIDAGLRAGVEIFFGFIGVERLSLEIAARVGVTHEIRVITQTAALDSVTSTTHVTRVSTSLMGNPWDIVTSTLALRYYF